MEINGLRVFVELQQASYLGHQHLPDFSGTSKEELLPKVHMINFPIGEMPVELSLNRDGVLGEEQTVNVELEGHGSIAKFTDPVQRFQASR